MKPFVVFANQLLVDIVIENVKDMLITIYLFIFKNQNFFIVFYIQMKHMIIHFWMFSKS
jgi:hypothetical protein